MKNIVSKFGGSASCGELSIKNIILLSQNTDRKVLVFSAIGKCPYIKEDGKVTDLLFGCVNSVKNVSKTRFLLNNIINKYKSLAKSLNIKTNITKIINNFYKQFLLTKDIFWFVSRGEFLTARLYAIALGIKFVPAEKAIVFDNEVVDYQRTQIKLNRYLNKYERIILPGFYGIDRDGKIKLFDRGGGDTTGAIVSKLIDADLYENWTDVDGVKPINPNIMPSEPIEKLSYQDLAIMTKYDAKVIHNSCVDILQDTKTKLQVRNIYNLSHKGTIVDKNGCCQKFLCYKIIDNKVNVITKKHNNNINSFIIHNYNLKDRLIDIYNKL